MERTRVQRARERNPAKKHTNTQKDPRPTPKILEIVTTIEKN
jgi:hypothetical protein